jgi:hypothetical protein
VGLILKISWWSLLSISPGSGIWVELLISLLGSFSFALVLVLYGVELCIAVLNHTYNTSILFNIVPLFYLI